jgi:Cys-Gly metallodipeptidase DUG1
LKEDKATGRFYGRGSSDDKGPILGWLNVIDAHIKTKQEMPVNLKMVFEGMEESGSNGLEEVVVKESKTFLKDVDAVCISYVLISCTFCSAVTNHILFTTCAFSCVKSQ